METMIPGIDKEATRMSIRPTDGRDTVEYSKAQVEANRTVDGFLTTRNVTFIKELSPEAMSKQEKGKMSRNFPVIKLSRSEQTSN